MTNPDTETPTPRKAWRGNYCTRLYTPMDCERPTPVESVPSSCRWIGFLPETLGQGHTSGLRELGECVLFLTPGTVHEKGNTAWFKGIWLGRDTKADENIVFNRTDVVKARTIKTNAPSAQWDRELFLTL